jgi:hypothetical protein
MTRKLIRGAAVMSAALLLLALAVRPLRAADLSGKWIYSFSTEDGVVDGILERVQAGEQLTALFEASLLKGGATEDQFTLRGESFAPSAGYSGPLTITGSPHGDGLSGYAMWDIYALTFTAKRAE